MPAPTGFYRLRKSQIALRFTVVRERLWLKFCFARRFNNLPQITRKLPPNGHCGKLILSRNETAGYFTVISPVVFQFQMLLFFFQSQPTGWITISCESRKLLGKSLVKSWKKIIFLKKRKKYIKYQTRKTSIQACIFCVFISYLTHFHIPPHAHCRWGVLPRNKKPTLIAKQNVAQISIPVRKTFHPTTSEFISICMCRRRRERVPSLPKHLPLPNSVTKQLSSQHKKLWVGVELRKMIVLRHRETTLPNALRGMSGRDVKAATQPNKKKATL